MVRTFCPEVLDLRACSPPSTPCVMLRGRAQAEAAIRTPGAGPRPLRPPIHPVPIQGLHWEPNHPATGRPSRPGYRLPEGAGSRSSSGLFSCPAEEAVPIFYLLVPTTHRGGEGALTKSRFKLSHSPCAQGQARLP